MAAYVTRTEHKIPNQNIDQHYYKIEFETKNNNLPLLRDHKEIVKKALSRILDQIRQIYGNPQRRDLLQLRVTLLGNEIDSGLNTG